jgi:hypothetical protein
MAYFWFRQRGEASLSVDSISGGRLSNAKGGLLYQTILAYRQPGERFVTTTDPSNIGIGGVLSQTHKGQERVKVKLNKAKRNYCVNRWELLTIVRTLEHFCKYLYGQAFHRCIDQLH